MVLPKLQAKIQVIRYSIIVPTYNRAELLKKCLEAVDSQNISRSEYELIVVNDGSKDNTEQILEEFKSNNPNLNFRWFSQKNGGPSKARNLGIKHSRGEIIFFTDDDCVVPNNWIKTLADGYLRHPEIAGAGGLYEFPEEFYKKNVFAQYHIFKMENLWYWSGALSKEIKNGIFSKNPAGNTSNMSYRKSILMEIGGFDESMRFPGFDDTDLKKRIMDRGHILLYIPFRVLHKRPFGFLDIAERMFYFGRGRYHFSKKNSDLQRLLAPRLDIQSQKLPEKFVSFYLLACADFILTSLGWEYQKITEKFKRR